MKYGQTVEIPPQYDPGKGTVALMEEFASSVGEMHEQAKTNHIRDHNHTVGQMEMEGDALTNGRRALAQKNPAESKAAKKKREKEEAVHRTLLQQFLDRLDELFRQIEAINERLEEIDTEISELERLRKLAEDGLLDLNNPAHAKLLKKYGITKEDIDSGNLSLILANQLDQRVDERTELQKRKQTLEEQAHEAITAVQADGMITPEEAEQFEQRLETLEVGVSAQVRLAEEASQELKNIAIDHHSDSYRSAKETGGLDLSDDGSPYRSFASTLEGEGSYVIGEHRQQKELSPNVQTTAPTHHDQSVQDQISTIPKP